MADHTGIEWTDATWNPIVGCSIVSPGCTNCYAMAMAARIEKMHDGENANRKDHIEFALSKGKPTDHMAQIMPPSHYAGTTKPSKAGAVWTGKVALVPEHILSQPLRWRRPRKIFVNSMGDLFHEDVPDEWIDRVFAVMALAPQHTFQVLTKRSARMRAYFQGCGAPFGFIGNDWTTLWHRRQGTKAAIQELARLGYWDRLGKIKKLPLPNVWLGVSTEDQRRADERLPDLRETPAAIRFVSAEPLLGPIVADLTGIDWLIAGGESGPGARPMHSDWARSLRDQCADAGVPFHFKQWGEFAPTARPTEKGTVTVWPDGHYGNGNANDHGGAGREMNRVGKKAAGRLLDGVEHNGFPQVQA